MALSDPVTDGLADAELSARAAQVFFAYARGVDDGDLDAISALASDDVVVTRAAGVLTGREEFLSLYRGFKDSPVQLSQHVISNVQAFRLADGSIRARAYFQASFFEAGDGYRLVVGQYDDTLREIGGRLVLTHKRIDVQRATKVHSDDEQWNGVEAITEGSS